MSSRGSPAGFCALREGVGVETALLDWLRERAHGGAHYERRHLAEHDTGSLSSHVEGCHVAAGDEGRQFNRS